MQIAYSGTSQGFLHVTKIGMVLSKVRLSGSQLSGKKRAIVMVVGLDVPNLVHVKRGGLISLIDPIAKQ